MRSTRCLAKICDVFFCYSGGTIYRLDDNGEQQGLQRFTKLLCVVPGECLQIVPPYAARDYEEGQSESSMRPGSVVFNLNLI